MAATTFLRRPLSWLQLIDRYGVQLSAAPNFAYDLCVRCISPEQASQLDLSRWSHALNGAEPVDAATLESFVQRFAAAGFRRSALCPVYGLAESTVYVSGISVRPPTITRVDVDRLENGVLVPVPAGQDGRDIVGCGEARATELLIVAPGSRKPLPDGRVGEIWLRSDSVAAGYWRRDDPAFGAAVLGGAGGFLRTGDLGARHDGELYVTGRLKDLIIVNGRNLHPHDLELAARSCGAELAGQVGAAFVVAPREQVVLVHEVKGRPTVARLDELANGIRGTLAREFGIQVAGVVLARKGTVRRTTSGKVQRSAMRELFLAGALDTLSERVNPGLRRGSPDPGRRPAAGVGAR